MFRANSRSHAAGGLWYRPGFRRCSLKHAALLFLEVEKGNGEKFWELAEGVEVRWIVLYCLYSWALVHLCFLYVAHGDVLRHTRIYGILMEL